MVNRVLMGNLGSSQYGLRVSTPGNDVLTGGTLVDNQLSFDSAATGTLRVLTSGMVVVPEGAVGTSVAVMYGVTLPSKPPVLLLRQGAGNGLRPTMQQAFSYIADDDVQLDRFLIRRIAAGGAEFYYVVFYPV